MNLSIAPLSAWPDGVAPPDMVTDPAVAFEAELRNRNGSLVQPASAIVQVRVPNHWLDTCAPDFCRAALFHYHEGTWRRHELQTIDQANGTAIMQAETGGFSIFAVGGVQASGAGFAQRWDWLLVPAIGLAIVAARYWPRRTRSATLAPPGPVDGKDATSPVDAKVSRLLTEMKNKEELLQFVNNAAHDLANPLTPIQLQLDLLADAAQEKADETQQRSLAVVQRNVEQLGLLISDLRDASKLQAGQLRFMMEPVDLTKLAFDVVEMYLPQATANQVDLQLEAAEPMQVMADGGRLTRVVTNFINNALKFTPPGGRVTVHVTREGSDALLLVRDTGLGVPPDDQPRLFKAFSQLHGTEEKAKGTGLGLYIAKGIVDAHGGRIGCASQGPGQGSTFWFALPLPSDSTPATPPQP